MSAWHGVLLCWVLVFSGSFLVGCLCSERGVDAWLGWDARAALLWLLSWCGVVCVWLGRLTWGGSWLCWVIW